MLWLWTGLCWIVFTLGLTREIADCVFCIPNTYWICLHQQSHVCVRTNESYVMCSIPALLNRPPLGQPSSPGLSPSSVGRSVSQPSSPGDSDTHSQSYEDDSGEADVTAPFGVLNLDKNEMWRSRHASQAAVAQYWRPDASRNGHGTRPTQSAQMYYEFVAPDSHNHAHGQPFTGAPRGPDISMPRRRLSDSYAYPQTHVPVPAPHTPPILEPPTDSWNRLWASATEVTPHVHPFSHGPPAAARHRTPSPPFHFYHHSTPPRTPSGVAHTPTTPTGGAGGFKGQAGAATPHDSADRASSFADPLSAEAQRHAAPPQGKEDESSRGAQGTVFLQWNTNSNAVHPTEMPAAGRIARPEDEHHQDTHLDSNFEVQYTCVLHTT
jgi:hypothetical protein